MALAMVGLSMARSSASCSGLSLAVMGITVLRDGGPHGWVLQAKAPGGDAGHLISLGQADARQNAGAVFEPHLVLLRCPWHRCGSRRYGRRGRRDKLARRRGSASDHVLYRRWPLRGGRVSASQRLVAERHRLRSRVEARL